MNTVFQTHKNINTAYCQGKIDAYHGNWDGRLANREDTAESYIQGQLDWYSANPNAEPRCVEYIPSMEEYFSALVASEGTDDIE